MADEQRSAELYKATYDDALGHMREARALLSDENAGPNRSRELSVALTELDTAILWRSHDLWLKKPAENGVADG